MGLPLAAALLLAFQQGGGAFPISSPSPDALEPSVAELLDRLTDRSAAPDERMAALEELAGSAEALPFERLQPAKTLVRRAWLADYVRCLGRCGAAALEELRGYAKHRDPLVQAEAFYALVQLDARGGEQLALAALRGPKSPAEAQVAALRGLAARDSLYARVEAARRLGSAEGALLLECLDVLRASPDPASATYLVDLVAAGKGRASNEAVELLQELTGYRIGRDAQSWRYWLRRHAAEGTPFRYQGADLEAPTETLSYLGIPIRSDKVVFVLDSSGSMETPLPERLSQTRGTRAVEELAQILPRLPASAAFDVVFFASNVSSFNGGLAACTEVTVERASAWLRARRFDGATNLYGGLEEAFEREGVEEVIVLSDGAPTAGEIQEPRRILARVSRWNRWRKVRVNTISLGAAPAEREFLYRLAAANGGICRVIQ